MPEPKNDTITFPMDDATRDRLKKLVDTTRHSNSVLIAEIQAMTGQTPEFVAAMVTTLFESMVELGLISDDTWLAMQVMWEERFHENLRKFRGDVQRAIDGQRAQQAQAAGIVAPSKGILLPNGGFKKVRDNPQA